jgi:thiamine biosynthesis protein ThiS
MSIVKAVQVEINGERRELEAGATVADVVRMLDLNERRIAVEINREIVPRQSYAERVLHEGDMLEIVHFVGGG